MIFFSYIAASPFGDLSSELATLLNLSTSAPVDLPTQLAPADHLPAAPFDPSAQLAPANHLPVSLKVFTKEYSIITDPLSMSEID